MARKADQFCFYCTVKDEFEEFNCEMFWASEEQFIHDYDGPDLVRYTAKIPSKFK